MTQERQRETQRTPWLNFWVTVLTGISDLELVFGFHSSQPLMSELVLICLETLWFQFHRIRCWRRRNWICKKVPVIPCVSLMLGGPSLRIVPPRSRKGGNDEGWLGTWESPLSTGSATWKSLESFIQLDLFSNSCILPVNSRIVSWSSTNLRLASVQSGTLPFHWGFSHDLDEKPSFASIPIHEEVDDLVDGVLLLEHDEVLLASTRSFHSVFLYFFGRSQPAVRVLNSACQSTKTRSLSSRRVLVCSF